MNEFPDYLSPAVGRALRLAQKLAGRDRSIEVEAHHVAVALLAGEPEGLASIAVARNGYQLSAPLMQLPAAAGGEAIVEAMSHAVLASLREARRLVNEVTGEILLCVLMDRDPDLLDSLKMGGLDAGAFRESVLKANAEPIAIVEPLEITADRQQASAGRIIDANVNRAREAARVLEDYARFCLDDAGLSRSFKEIRHRLRELPEQLGLAPIAGRDTPHDVGTLISTKAEYRRTDARHVVAANAKRLQESLRSLEEFGKTLKPEVARQIESQRYEAYTLEVALGSVRRGQERLADVRLYWLFTASTCKISPERAVTEAIAGGVGMIQLREKSLDDGALLTRAKQLRAWTRQANIPFIVNDRPDIARLADADGVHLGQTDLPVSAARAIMGSNAIVGVSAHNIDQVRHAVRDGADYIGVGPTFASTTKDFNELAGLDLVRAAVAETSLPAFVLGGVNAQNLPQVIAGGGRRIAVSAAISGSEHPRNAAQSLLIPQ